MSLINQLSIKSKITVIPVVAIIGFIASLIANTQINNENTARLADIQNRYFPVVQSSRENIVKLNRMVELYNAAVSTGETDMIDAAKETLKHLNEKSDKQISLWPSKKNEVSAIKLSVKKYSSLAARLSTGMIDGNLTPSEMPGLVKSMNEALVDAKAKLKAFNESSLAAFNLTVSESNEASDNALLTSLILSFVVIAIIILVSLSVVLSIIRNINSMRASLKDIAQGEGDLTKRISAESKDEIGDLIHWFNLFMEKLHSSINDVVSSIGPLASVSSDLDSITSKTRAITEEQSRATDEVTESVSDMFQSVQGVAQSALSAAEAAKEADTEAQNGRGVVTQSVESINNLASEIEHAASVIGKLESDTENVGAILDVIKGIAEQTNLLALNAAIEAARAGEQGRGFAVVADEVRTLASRTQDSTQEIQRVIEELQSAAQSAAKVMSHSQLQVKTSVEHASKTDKSLATITERVESITQMNSDIAAATGQQELSSNSIKKNVEGIRNNAEAAVKNVQEVEAASASLISTSENLRKITSQFIV